MERGACGLYLGADFFMYLILFVCDLANQLTTKLTLTPIHTLSVFALPIQAFEASTAVRY